MHVCVCECDFMGPFFECVCMRARARACVCDLTAQCGLAGTSSTRANI